MIATGATGGTAPWVTFQLREVNGLADVGTPTKQETCTKRPLIMNRGNSSPTVDTAAPLTPVDPRLLNIRYTEQCVHHARSHYEVDIFRTIHFHVARIRAA